MIILPETVKSPLIRTDFSDQQAWEACRTAIDGSAMAAFDVGIEVFVEIIDDPVYRDITVEQLLELEDVDTTYVMLANRETMTGAEHPILFLDLFEEQRGHTVRVVSSELCDVVTNVDNANITIEDYARAAEEAGDVGVFRGFA